MPIVDITLIDGRSPEVIRAIADGVHDALVEHFGVPTDDRFQIVHQKQRDELIYDRTFLGGPRSDGFVMVRITVGKERPELIKHALYRAIAHNLDRNAHIDPEDVFIALNTVALSDLSVAGGRPFRPPHLTPRP
ncbi:tautomerase family protein [Microbacterium sp. CPCC 204701]|uniref:tautomerase family protein n=1 Tax=Microbacterium sp. CPCC 204701 TaxID=2493084 RepID=UPI000FD9E19C|nr:tautomerase family protein [Microbacterium sp. CPCC 204701]